MNDNRTTVADETTYTDLRSANIARQAAWCPDQVPDLSFRGNELAGETGEVCNVIKKLERERLGWRGSRDTVEHLAEELADVVICADLAAISAGIDLDAAVIAKFNATSEKVGLPHRLTELQHRREASSPALKVKPLEWHGPDFEDEYWAASLDLKYVIHPPNERGVRWLGGVGGYFRLVDEAKAVAEKHNEARIRSALGEHP